DARVMYASRWSASTDRRGAVAFKVGPLPIPVRWRIEAPGYAAERTTRVEVVESKDMTVADVKLRPAAILRVRVHLPDDKQEFAGGSLALVEPTDEHLVQYVTKARQPLHDGDVPFRIE